jgi:RNase P/RNase MRP subunit p30
MKFPITLRSSASSPLDINSAMIKLSMANFSGLRQVRDNIYTNSYKGICFLADMPKAIYSTVLFIVPATTSGNSQLDPAQMKIDTLSTWVNHLGDYGAC